MPEITVGSTPIYRNGVQCGVYWPCEHPPYHFRFIAESADGQAISGQATDADDALEQIVHAHSLPAEATVCAG